MPRNGRSGAPLELERFYPYRLSVLANTVSSMIARDYGARFGLTVPEWRTLAVLGRFAPLTAGGVCERTAMDKVRVSRAVARLVQGGLVTRSADPGDGRRVLLDMSAAGRTVYREIVPLARAHERDLLTVLDAAETAQFDRLLAKLQQRADALQEGGAESRSTEAGSGDAR